MKKELFYQILVNTIHEKIKENHTTLINLKNKLKHGMINLNGLTDHILYQIFKNILSISQKKLRKKIDNPSIRMYIDKTENRITLKVKTEYHLELLTPETTKSLGKTENNITKDNNGEDLPHLEVLLVYCNIVNKNYQQDSRVVYTFVLNKLFGSLSEISPKNLIFLKTCHSDIEIWFADQNSQPLYIEYKINLTLVIK